VSEMSDKLHAALYVFTLSPLTNLDCVLCVLHIVIVFVLKRSKVICTVKRGLI